MVARTVALSMALSPTDIAILRTDAAFDFTSSSTAAESDGGQFRHSLLSPSRAHNLPESVAFSKDVARQREA